MCTVSAGPYVYVIVNSLLSQVLSLFHGVMDLLDVSLLSRRTASQWADINELKQNTDADFSLQIAAC